MATALPFKISTLIFIHNEYNELLLIKRAKSPNKDCWSPIGGKLEMEFGESPYECARRESFEEVGLHLEDKDLNCFGYISEKSYEGNSHWLLFLFNCNQLLKEIPPEISEGQFAFFKRSEIDTLKIPETDKKLLWPYYDSHRNGFIGLRSNCDPNHKLHLTEELSLLKKH
jgi:8-oxo-dGTP diphosphatase